MDSRSRAGTPDIPRHYIFFHVEGDLMSFHLDTINLEQQGFEALLNPRFLLTKTTKTFYKGKS